jgi:ketosteroid isomerase-like protein
MKNDKFLIGIIVGIVVLVVVAIIVVLSRGQEEYIPDDTPAGVVHNYFLALQREEYDKAYQYLADDLENKPDLDRFITTVDDFGNRSEAALQVGQSTITNSRARVEVTITTYSGGGLFDSGSYSNRNTAHLRLNDNGAWQLIEFPYPYWGYDWNQEKDLE